MLVLKFGGTSVADAQPIARAADAVAREAGPRAVVVSALAGVTDRLVQLARQAADGRGSAALGALERLAQRHHDLAAHFPGPTPPALTQLLDEYRTAAEQVVRDAAAARVVTPAAMDALLATGELMSAVVIASAFERLGVPAIAVDARTVITTDDRHTSAQPLLAPTRERAAAVLSPLLDRGAVPVLGGFVGSTKTGTTTTLGRGGSDVTAAVLGVCLAADEVQIWTDVDGVLDADPRVVANARTIPHLSFGEAGDLARYGAKVLHPSTIDVVVAHSVPVRVLNSRRGEQAGTRVDGVVHNRATPVALSCRRNLVTLAATARNGEAAALADDVVALLGPSASASHVLPGADGRTIVVVDDAAVAADISGSLKDIADVRIEREAGLVAVVGDQACGRMEVAAEILSTLDGLVVQAVSLPVAGRTIVVFMEDADVPDAMTRLHERFCGSASGEGDRDVTSSPQVAS